MRDWIIALVVATLVVATTIGAEAVGASTTGRDNQGSTTSEQQYVSELSWGMIGLEGSMGPGGVQSLAAATAPPPPRNRLTPTRTPTRVLSKTSPTITPTPTETPTVTPVPPTHTPAPPTATFTPAPPTPTFTPAPPTATYTPIPPPGGRLSLSRSALLASETVEVVATGFGRRETLSIWLTDPTDQVFPSADRVTGLDGNAVLVIPLPEGARSGPWALTVQGQATRRQAIAAFSVAGVATTAPRPSEVPDVTDDEPWIPGAPDAPKPPSGARQTTATPTVTPTPSRTPTPTRTPTVTVTPTPARPYLAHLMPPKAPGGPLPLRLRQTYFGNAARMSGVPVEVLLAIASVESGFVPTAKGPYLPQFAGTENENALGMMQFLPSTYRLYMNQVDRVTGKQLGIRGVWDPESAVYAASFYLRDSGAPGNMRRALLAYNNADWYVDLILAWASYYANGGNIGYAPHQDSSAILKLPEPGAPTNTTTPAPTPTQSVDLGSNTAVNEQRELGRQADNEALAFWIWYVEDWQTQWSSPISEYQAIAY